MKQGAFEAIIDVDLGGCGGIEATASSRQSLGLEPWKEAIRAALAMLPSPGSAPASSAAVRRNAQQLLVNPNEVRKIPIFIFI